VCGWGYWSMVYPNHFATVSLRKTFGKTSPVQKTAQCPARLQPCTCSHTVPPDLEECQLESPLHCFPRADPRPTHTTGRQHQLGAK
jgi:hypothetical protein